jgi:DNA-binding XRE family transcriptional regulator
LNIFIIVENIPWTASLLDCILWNVSNIFNQSKKTLAERVKTLRTEAGMSQEQLALEADIDRTYASQIERTIGNPSLKVICKLAEVLKVSPIELLGK